MMIMPSTYLRHFPRHNQNHQLAPHPDPHIVVVGVPHRPTRGMPLRLLAAGKVEDYYTFTHLKLKIVILSLI